MDNSIYHNRILTPVRLTGLLALMALLLGACGGTATPAATPTQATSSAALSSLDLASDPELGQYLVDNNGMTVYVLTKDTPNTSSCDATCLQNWPPLVSSNAPKAGPGVDASLIGVATLSSGDKVVTYNQKPLYYKLTDKKAGDKTGEDINDVWYMVTAAGQPLKEASSESVPTATAAPTTAVSEPTIMAATDPTYGQILVDGKGMVLYAYAKDTPDQSACTGACLKYWPPLLTLGKPIAGSGADDSKLGSTKLADGRFIVTYNHIPLYYFVKDTKPGDTSGQGVDNAWAVVSPDGEPVLK